MMKQRHWFLPQDPDFCLIFLGSGWNKAVPWFVCLFGWFFFQQEAGKATAHLFYILNWPRYRAAQLNHSHFLSQAGPFLPHTLLAQNQWGLLRRCTGPEHRTTLDSDSNWETPACFLGHMVLTSSFWTWSCVVALAQDQLTVKQFPSWLGKRTKQAHLRLQKTMSA